MRRKNWRFIIAGAGLLVLCAAFFLGMMGMAPRSTDPVGMMREVGEVVGVVGAISLALMVAGLVGRRV